MMPSKREIVRRGTVLAAAICCWAAVQVAPALGQESGCLDSLAVRYLESDQTAAPVRSEYQALPDLDLMLERQLIADQMMGLSYYTLSGFWGRNREQGLAALWRQSNAAFLAKPTAQRTGEGLIPDIQVPLPVLGKMLGAGAEIKLNGLYKFTLGGQQTEYPENRLAGTSGQQSGNFDLKIKQDYKVDLEGVVGDRMHVLIDYDSQIETDKKSKVRLRYEGKEDEILQRLEAGDTEFSIGGSSLAGGLTTVHKGLFGIKAEAKLAGLELTAIASKDEGQSQSNTYTAGASGQNVLIEDVNYIKHQFFKLPLAPGDSLMDVRVVAWLQGSGAQTNRYTHYCINRSWQDFAGQNKQDTITFSMEEKRSPEFFTYNVPHILPRPDYLYLRQPLNDDDMLGVAYKVKNRYTGVVSWVPDPDSSITNPDTTVHHYVLLLKPQRCRPPDSVNGYAWNYELRNFYDLGGRQISNLSLKLQKRSGNDFIENDSVSQKTFLHLIGLDADQNGAVDIDWVKAGADEGYFFTPDTMPFNSNILPDPNPALYNKYTYDPALSKYRFVASYTSADASYRFLQSTGRILEGSVRVFLNDQAVDPSKYRVDYDIGEIEFTDDQTRQAIKQANARLRIDYQYLPSFALGSKTLAGVRGVYKFSEKAVLGGTWLYRSEQTPEDKPRLGEEPRRIIVAGLDGHVQANPSFLTRAVDALPLVETEAQSSISLAGEYAANFPNPNTKGQVYIDDMDGAKQSDGLVLDRLYWSHSSAPAGKPDTMYANSCYWYKPDIAPSMGDINTAITDERIRKELVTPTMRFHVEPHNNDTGSWAGITNVVSQSGMDFTERKLLNVWVKGTAGKLHIDLGKEISEDQVRRKKGGVLIPADNVYNSEPLGPNNSQTRTNLNDVGVDGVQGADDENKTGDDGNDDYPVSDPTSSANLPRINGTENNGQFDTEDLLRTGRRPGEAMAPRNNYYTFDFDLATGANAKGWHVYSVPLTNAKKVGAPYDWNGIFYARVWVDGLSQPSDVELALIEVSGNNWIEQPITKCDTTSPDSIRPSERLTIGVKNNRDDAGYSADPPYDPGKDENGNLKFEQSLSFNLDSLLPGHMAMGRKSLRTNENNYNGYHTLRLYVKGESSQDTFFVRLSAADSSQYYQYKAATRYGWDREIVIDLDRLSSLKKAPYSGFREDGAYSVRGSPSLTNISRIYLGVISGRTQPYTGSVWFDDLRLDDVRRDRGSACNSTIELKLADLLTLSGGYNYAGAHWYNMGGQGTGAKTVSYNFGANLAFSKFYLDRLGFSVPLSFTQNVSESFFELGGDDIRLTEEESRDQRSWSRTRTGGFSLARTKPTGWWLTDATINRVSYQGNWSQTSGFSRTGANSGSTFNQSASYSWSPSQNPGLSVFKLTRFYYLPSALSSSWSSNQTRNWSLEKSTGVQSTSGSVMTRSLSGTLGWKLTDELNASFTQNRDLMQKKWQGDPAKIDGWLIHRLGLGSEISRNQQLTYNTTISWLRLIKPSVNYTTTYSEQHSILLAAGSSDSVNIMRVTNVNALTVGNDFPIGTWLGKLAPRPGKAKNDSLVTGSQQWLIAKMLEGLDSFLKGWQNVQVSFTQNKSGDASGLTSRPSLWYQIGWHRQPVGIGRLGQSAADNNTLGNSYTASTQSRLGPVNLSGSWGRTDNWTTNGPITNYQRVDNWPTVRADIVSVEKLWPQAMSSSRLASSYAMTRERSWQQDRGLSRDAVRKAFSPLADWSCTWKPRFSTSLAYDFQIQDTREPTLRYSSGWQRDYTETKKLTGSFSYSFTAQKGLALNLWKLGKRRFKFDNELRTSLSGSYSKRTQTQLEVNKALEDFPPTADQVELSLTAQAEYRFSNSITGSMSANYGTVDNKVNSVPNSRTYGLNVLVSVVF